MRDLPIYFSVPAIIAATWAHAIAIREYYRRKQQVRPSEALARCRGRMPTPTTAAADLGLGRPGAAAPLDEPIQAWSL